MGNLKYRAIIAPILILTCCLLPSLLFYFLGYVDWNNFNNDLIKTNCNIIEHEIIGEQYTYDCNCDIDSSSSYTNCETCEDVRYDGYIITNYTDTVTTYNITFNIYNNDGNKNNTINALNKYYPIGDFIKCYYEKDNPTKVRREKVDTGIFLGLFALFCVMTVFITVGWIFAEIYLYWYN